MTIRPTLHLCIATGQNLANLIPALQLKASKVVVLETTEMRVSASNLKRTLESHGIEVERKPFDDSTPETIQASAQKIGMAIRFRHQYDWSIPKALSFEMSFFLDWTVRRPVSP